MNDNDFAALRTEIDHAIGGSPDPQVGITMGFGLAGEFLVRNLLEIICVNIGGIEWDMRTYQGRIVYPDPTMGEFEFITGRH